MLVQMKTSEANMANRQVVFDELVRMGMQEAAAAEVAHRYFYNELTYRDLEHLEEKLDIKLVVLKNEINTKVGHLEEKLVIFKNELNDKIDTLEEKLNDKIDTKFDALDIKFDALDIKFDAKFKLHNWMITFLITTNIAIVLAVLFK
ncbi:Bdr family repetitive protein [Borrelia sp. RT1S]|uniref:Bdr family repetitive protein n=1 Tax=Borrelia sp. RT1S TaxID=2898580 RepID=UPI001E5A990B|nr:Bdr family repetitive protein [Borrelia sp. RT1S]UGQ17895.1 Bdr family repetitive protein [Borrelia sp. RT1S]